MKLWEDLLANGLMFGVVWCGCICLILAELIEFFPPKKGNRFESFAEDTYDVAFLLFFLCGNNCREPVYKTLSDHWILYCNNILFYLVPLIVKEKLSNYFSLGD